MFYLGVYCVSNLSLDLSIISAAAAVIIRASYVPVWPSRNSKEPE